MVILAFGSPSRTSQVFIANKKDQLTTLLQRRVSSYKTYSDVGRNKDYSQTPRVSMGHVPMGTTQSSSGDVCK